MSEDLNPLAAKKTRLDEAGASASTASLAQEASFASGSDNSTIAAARVDANKNNEVEEKPLVLLTQGSAPGVENTTTMTFPKQLPMEYEYEEPEFYVRECYPKYYARIIRLLYSRKMKVVTITGTPGIGKSIFFAYFFLRYSLEYPDATVITASFAKRGDNSEMESVVVWKDGKVIGQDDDSESAMIGLMKKHQLEATGGVIHLYDGPPRRCPRGVQAVCFTSPNKSWFSQIEKSQYRPRLFMPLWNLEELRTAAQELDLTMVDTDGDREGEPRTTTSDLDDVVMVADLVGERYPIFGGVARECLATDAAFVETRRCDIEEIIATYHDENSVKRLISMSQAQLTHHRICHYVPKPDNWRAYTITAPTKFVERLLVERLSKIVIDKRKEFIQYLKGNGPAASFRGVLFEVDVHDALSTEYKFKARRLGTQDFTEFDCKRSTPAQNENYCFFDSNFSASALSSGPYHVPRARNFVSIDSFYYPKPDDSSESDTNVQVPLWLFQMTVAQMHPVSGEGITLVLERLGLLEMAKTDPEQVVLIFVVPKENARNFERQEITFDIPDDEGSVSKLKGVGAKRESALNAVGIYKIGELRERLNVMAMARENVAEGLSLKLLCSLLSEHDKRKQKEPGLKGVLDAMPQFVWGV